MFGTYALGEAPYGFGESALRVDLYGEARIEVAVQMGRADLRGAASLRVNADNRILAASDDYTSTPGDRIPNRLFAGTLRQALRFSRSILGGADFGSYTLGLGEAILTNADGAYDHLVGTHAFDGRPVTIRLGDASDPHDRFGVVFSGQSTGSAVDDDELVIELRDNGYLLEVPASAETFAGTGGIEGGEDLKGRRKPRSFGFCANVMPASLTPATTLLFAVGYRAVRAIPAVYVRGVKLQLGQDHPTVAALEAATIADGFYHTCLAKALFRLETHNATEAGQITADVEGELLDGALGAHTAAVVEILARDAGVTVDRTSFERIGAEQPAPIGYYLGVGDESTIAVVMSRLMASVGGWVGFRRAGTLEVGILRGPVGDPLAPRFDDVDIVTIDRDRLPDALEPPPYRLRGIYARNWTLQSDGLSGSVTTERRAALAEAYQISEPAQSDAVKLNHPLAQDPPPFDAYFRDAADARAEAWRRLRLYRANRSLYRMQLRTAPFGLDLGREVFVTYPRWDLPKGKALRIVSVDEDTENNIVEVVAYG